MYLNDAQDVAVPRKIQEQPKVDPKLMAWYSEAQGRGRGHNVGRRQNAGGDVCINENGYHACYRYRDWCPLVDTRKYVHNEGNEGIVFTRRVF